jgi:2'-5' RNA ligase
MASRGSLDRSETLRLFYGLPVPSEAVPGLAEWTSRTFAGARGVRPIPPAHLHVTLAFLGARPVGELVSLRAALREAATGVDRPVLAPARYRETERVAMIVFNDESGRAALLYERLSKRLEQLGSYRPERRTWLPHVTVARFAKRPRLRPALPALAELSPSDAALYHSVLRPDGAQYSILEAVSLGG